MRKEKNNKNIYLITNTKLSSKNGFVIHAGSALIHETTSSIQSHDCVIVWLTGVGTWGKNISEDFFQGRHTDSTGHWAHGPRPHDASLSACCTAAGPPRGPLWSPWRSDDWETEQQIERINVSILLRKTQNNALQQTLIQFKLNTEWITLCVWFLNVSKTRPIFNVMRLIFLFCLTSTERRFVSNF